MYATTGNTQTTFPYNVSQTYQGAITIPIEQVVYSGLVKSIDITNFVVNDNIVMDAKTDYRALFNNYYCKWKQETCFESRSDIIFSDPNYRAIVNMGNSAIPYIKEIIAQKPNFIVHALHLITGEEVKDRSLISKYKGFTSLKRYCKLWVKKLK